MTATRSLRMSSSRTTPEKRGLLRKIGGELRERTPSCRM